MPEQLDNPVWNVLCVCNHKHRWHDTETTVCREGPCFCGTFVEAPGRYIVKTRTRTRATYTFTGTKRQGSRRVWRWSPWRSISRHQIRETALAYIERQKRRGGLEDLAVFFAGRRVGG